MQTVEMDGKRYVVKCVCNHTMKDYDLAQDGKLSVIEFHDWICPDCGYNFWITQAHNPDRKYVIMLPKP